MGDGCVVGIWQVTAYRLRDRLGDGTEVEFAGSGGVTTLRADGTGVDDYSGGLLLDATDKGHRYRVTIRGTVTYRYRTAENRLVQSEVTPDGTMSIAEDQRTVATRPLATSAEPMAYTCGDGTLRITDSTTTVELRRS